MFALPRFEPNILGFAFVTNAQGTTEEVKMIAEIFFDWDPFGNVKRPA
jgi:hypothetical protein